jgi:hypothetical protein
MRPLSLYQGYDSIDDVLRIRLQHSRVSSVASPPTPSKNGILRNANGQRIDFPLKYSVTLVSELKPRKFCSHDPCQNTHGAKLKPEQLNALSIYCQANVSQLGV